MIFWLGFTCVPMVFAGCMIRAQFNLRYTSPAPSAEQRGSLAVQVIDGRMPGRGGANSLLIGQGTNDFGVVVSSVLAAPGQEPVPVVENLVRETVAHTGYAAVAPGPGVPTLTVTVTSFWLSNAAGTYMMSFEANATLSQGAGSPPIWSNTLTGQGTNRIPRGDFHPAVEGGFQMMLDDAVRNLTQLIQSPEFQTAYVQMSMGGQMPVPATPPTVPPAVPPTAPPAVPPQATPPAPSSPATGGQAQCQLNSDCPVGQHCAGGACNLQCRENRDCSNNMTCNIQNGRCE